jgi:hypothetical protein
MNGQQDDVLPEENLKAQSGEEWGGGKSETGYQAG